MQESYNAIDKTFVPILCPSGFNAAKRGNIPNPFELEQLLSMADHKLY